MIIPRLASTALRAAQFICAAVVLGLTSYLLHLALEHNIGPFSRLRELPSSNSNISLLTPLVHILTPSSILRHDSRRIRRGIPPLPTPHNLAHRKLHRRPPLLRLLVCRLRAIAKYVRRWYALWE
jgi:hypothetical protein